MIPLSGVRRALFCSVLVLGFIGLVPFAVGCGGDDEGAEPSATAPEGSPTEPSGDPIVIGIANSETGFMGPFDIPTRVGVERAVADFNSEGGVLGRPLETEFCDSKSDTTQSARCGQDLLDKGAAMLVVSCDFDFGGPAATVAQQRDVIAFSCAGSPNFGPRGIGSNAFTMEGITPGEGAAMAEWGYNEKGWRRAYVLTDTFIDYSNSLGQYFTIRWRELAGDEGIVGEDTFKNDDPSFASQVSRLRAASPQPDVVFIASCPPGGATLMRQIRSGGIDVALASGICFDSDTWIESVPGLSNYFDMAELSTYGDDPRPEVNEFFESVSAEFGEAEQPVYAAYGYSVVEAWTKAVEEAGGLEDTAAIVEALEAMEEEELLIGPTTFGDVHGPTNRPYRIHEVRGGTHHLVGTWTAQEVPPVE